MNSANDGKTARETQEGEFVVQPGSLGKAAQSSPTSLQSKVLIELTSHLGRVQDELRTTGSLAWVFPNEAVTVGRSRGDAQLAIQNDSSLSRRHFEIAFNGSECRITDLESANGTYLNGQRVRQSVVSNGDEICAGKSVFRVAVVTDQNASKSEDEHAPSNSGDTQVIEIGRHDVPPALRPPVLLPPIAEPTSDRAESALDDLLDEATLLIDAEHDVRGARSGSTVDLSESIVEADAEAPPEVITIRLIEDESHIDDPSLISRFMTWIRAEQLIVIGGSDYDSDWRLPHTVGLEPRHFQVQFDGHQCTIESLDRNAGIRVNGQPVHSSTLQHGDRIDAGNGIFVVQFS